MQQRLPIRLATVLALLALSGVQLPFARPVLAATSSPHDQTRPHVMADAFQQSEARKLGPSGKAFTPRPLALNAASRPLREVFGYVNAGNLGDPSVGYASWNFSLISTVAYFGIAVDSNGNLIHGDTGWNVWNSSTGAGLVNTAHQYGARVVISLIQHDSGMCGALDNSMNTVNQVMAIMNGADGVNLDYEGSNGACAGSDIRTLINRIMSQLKAAMPNGYLSIATYGGSATDPNGMFDIPTLSGITDSFFVMAYDLDYSNWSQPPVSCPSRCENPVAPLTAYAWNDTGIAAQYLAVAPASKIILGIPYYGRNACVYTGVANGIWYTPSPQATSPTYIDSVTTNGSPGVSNYAQYRDVYDIQGQDPWAAWSSSTRLCEREGYFDDTVSLGAKYDLVNRDNLRGAGIFTFDYGGGSPELWSSLADHFSKIPGAPTSVTACGGDGFAEVQWTQPSANGGPITSYTVKGSPGGSASVNGGNQVAVPGLSDGTAYTFTVTAANAYGSGPTSAASAPTTPSAAAGFPGQYHGQAPARVLDTRSGLGGTRLGGGQSLDFQVLGQGGVPASGVSAVALNLTVTNTVDYGFLTAWAAGSCRPFTSNLNFYPGQIIPNLVLVPVGANGKVSVYNASLGGVDLVADVEGWVSSTVAGGSGRFQALSPTRVADSRLGQGFAGALGPGQVLSLDLGGKFGLPASGVSAVALNLTVTNPRSNGFITAFPAGGPPPNASNLNYGPGQTIAARALVQTGGAQASVSFYNASSSSTDLVVDLNGWFTDSSSSAGNGLFTGLTPVRLLDTRVGTGAAQAAIPAQAGVSLQVAGQFGVPASGASAVLLNVTVTDTGGNGFLTVYPDGGGVPTASDLNWPPGLTIPNLVLVKLPADGKIDFFNGSPAGSIDLVADMVGWTS